jgi:serine/threonine-protein kinase
MAGTATLQFLHDGDLLAGRYRLVEPLASGGMSTVWRARDERLSRVVAVKILDSKWLADDSSRARMRVEAQALAQLAHPHIANVYDYGETDHPGMIAVPYLVMELVDGICLAPMLAERGSLPWPAAVSAAAQVAHALAAAHARGVVHRDITPANVLLTASGVTVVDFGICAVTGERETSPDGDVVGTPGYLAPERIDAQPVSPAADVYSLGVLLYRMLSGRLPWQATTVAALLHAQRDIQPEPLPPIAGLPAEVGELCLRCLAKQPGDRPDAADVARVLLAALDHQPFAGDQRLSTIDSALVPPNLDPSAMATHILAWSARTSPTTDPRHWQATSHYQRRKTAKPAALAATVILASVLAWVATDWIPASELAQPQALGAPAPSTTPPPRCKVTYQVTEDTDSHFTATIAVTNTGRDPISNWQVAFELPADQHLDAHMSEQWQQTGRTVASTPTPDPLTSGTSAQLAFAGDYTATNPLPTQFWVNDGGCTATILGPSGTPEITTADQPPTGAGQTGASRAGGPDESKDKGKEQGQSWGAGQPRGEWKRAISCSGLAGTLHKTACRVSAGA